MNQLTGRWQRRAEVNKGLIVLLVVLVLAAGIFWAVKLTNRPEREVGGDPTTAVYDFVCMDCGAEFQLGHEEWRTAERDENNQYKCAKCGKVTARFRRPGSDQLLPGGG